MYLDAIAVFRFIAQGQAGVVLGLRITTKNTKQHEGKYHPLRVLSGSLTLTLPWHQTRSEFNIGSWSIAAQGCWKGSL